MTESGKVIGARHGDARHVQWSVTSTPPTTTPRTHHEPKRQKYTSKAWTESSCNRCNTVKLLCSIPCTVSTAALGYTAWCTAIAWFRRLGLTAASNLVWSSSLSSSSDSATDGQSSYSRYTSHLRRSARRTDETLADICGFVNSFCQHKRQN